MVQSGCMYITIILGSLSILGMTLYYVQVKKNKRHGPSALRKLRIAFVASAALTGVVFVGVSRQDDQVRPWPREFIAGQKPDFSQVPGVTPKQEMWAASIVESTYTSLQRWAAYDSALKDGYVPMSSSPTVESAGNVYGDFVHVFNFDYMRDEYQLDSRYPESLLYGLKDDKYTLLAAMYVMYGVSIKDPFVLDVGGPLLQWHDHSDLARGLSLATYANVHVWVVSNKCGVFAAADHPQLVGVADVPPGDRVDLCL